VIAPYDSRPSKEKQMSRSIASRLTVLVFVVAATIGCESSEPVVTPAADAPKPNLTPTTVEGGKLKGANKQARGFKVQQ
jgi:hypothetical protein